VVGHVVADGLEGFAVALLGEVGGDAGPSLGPAADGAFLDLGLVARREVRALAAAAAAQLFEIAAVTLLALAAAVGGRGLGGDAVALQAFGEGLPPGQQVVLARVQPAPVLALEPDDDMGVVVVAVVVEGEDPVVGAWNCSFRKSRTAGSKAPVSVPAGMESIRFMLTRERGRPFLLLLIWTPSAIGPVASSRP
jgi:hypothetical protein